MMKQLLQNMDRKLDTILNNEKTSTIQCTTVPGLKQFDTWDALVQFDNELSDQDRQLLVS